MSHKIIVTGSNGKSPTNTQPEKPSPTSAGRLSVLKVGTNGATNKTEVIEMKAIEATGSSSPKQKESPAPLIQKPIQPPPPSIAVNESR